MSPSTILLVLISVAVLAIVVYCLLGPREVWDFDSGAGLLTQLAKRKDRVLRVIQDLEQEKEAGSLDEAEFVRLRNEYKRRAVEILREQDRLRTVRVRRLSGGAAVSARDRQRVETLVQQRRRQITETK